MRLTSSSELAKPALHIASSLKVKSSIFEYKIIFSELALLDIANL